MGFFTTTENQNTPTWFTFILNIPFPSVFGIKSIFDTSAMEEMHQQEADGIFMFFFLMQMFLSLLRKDLMNLLLFQRTNEAGTLRRNTSEIGFDELGILENIAENKQGGFPRVVQT